MRTHWDLPSRTSDAEAAALVASLDRPSKILTLATESNRQETNSSPSTSLSAQSQHSTIDERHASTPPSSASENENGDVCLEIAQGQEADCTQKPLMPRFIELCINSGRNKRIVAEIDVTEMKTDAEVFVAIADKYRQSRKGRGCVALIVPQFVRRWITISKFECSFMRPGDIVFRKVRAIARCKQQKCGMLTLQSLYSISISRRKSRLVTLAYLQSLKLDEDDTTTSRVPWIWTRSCLPTTSFTSWTTRSPTPATLGCYDYRRSYTTVF